MATGKNVKQIATALVIGTFSTACSYSMPPGTFVQKAHAQGDNEDKERKQSFKSSITERVQSVIAKQLKKDVSEIKPASNFIKDLGCDSLDCVEILMALESEFQIDISDDAANKLVTVRATTDYVRSAIEKKASGKAKKEKEEK
ncbi:MAG: acyl carrier protein [Candidatus Obscuribacterales bacterium]|nr:acyl carrier protein [Candidatus Obscuribacterales bacterium]